MRTQISPSTHENTSYAIPGHHFPVVYHIRINRPSPRDPGSGQAYVFPTHPVCIEPSPEMELVIRGGGQKISRYPLVVTVVSG